MSNLKNQKNKKSQYLKNMASIGLLLFFLLLSGMVVSKCKAFTYSGTTTDGATVTGTVNNTTAISNAISNGTLGQTLNDLIEGAHNMTTLVNSSSSAEIMDEVAVAGNSTDPNHTVDTTVSTSGNTTTFDVDCNNGMDITGVMTTSIPDPDPVPVYTCSNTSWSPSTNSYCSGTKFTQTSNCGSTRTATGTKYCCTDTSWAPATNTVCSGTSFTQTSNCGNTRSATGTKYCPPTCTDTSWSPSTSSYCSGTKFTQTSNCGNTRSATGTKYCPPVPAPTLTLTASPNPVSYNSPSTLSWNTTNASSCHASGNWSGWKNNNGGSKSTGNLTSAKTYSLECWNSKGVSTGKKSVTVNVNACVPDCSDESNHCVGTTFTDANACGVNNCSGTKQPTYSSQCVYTPTGDSCSDVNNCGKTITTKTGICKGISTNGCPPTYINSNSCNPACSDVTETCPACYNPWKEVAP